MAEKPCGVDVPLPGKDFRPMRREANVWPSNGLTGAMTEYRTVQDFGGPKGWPRQAPASAQHTSSVSDPSAPSMNDAQMALTPTIGRGTGRRKNPSR